MKNETKQDIERARERERSCVWQKKSSNFKLDCYKIDGTFYVSVSLASIKIMRKSDRMMLLASCCRSQSWFFLLFHLPSNKLLLSFLLATLFFHLIHLIRKHLRWIRVKRIKLGCSAFACIHLDVYVFQRRASQRTSKQVNQQAKKVEKWEQRAYTSSENTFAKTFHAVDLANHVMVT